MLTKITKISCGHCWNYQQKLQEENEKLKAENEQLSGISGQLKLLSVDDTIKLNQIICPRIKELETQLERANKLYKDLTAENTQLKAQLQNYTKADRINKFRLGDRVAVHREGRLPFRGTIFNILHGKLSVIEDGFYSAHDDSPFLPGQCKKLIKKRKRNKVSQVERCEHSGVELGKSKRSIQVYDEVIAAAVKLKNSKPHLCPGCKGDGRLGGSFVTLGGHFAERDIECPSCFGLGVIWEPK
jgi:cell division protein FtsB